MAETPDPKTEQLLRDFARQRREALGEVSLHSVTRRMLVEAAQRESPRAMVEGREQPKRWAGLFPRLALAVALFAVLATIVVGVDRRQAGQMKVAGISPASPAPASHGRARAPAFEMDRADEKAKSLPARQGGVASDRTINAPEAFAAPLAKSESLQLSRVVPPERPDSSSMVNGLKDLDIASVEKTTEIRKQPSMLPANPPKAAAPATITQNVEVAAPIFRESFKTVQSGARGKNLLSPPSPNVLQQFQLVISNEVVQVIDGDGSIYLGSPGLQQFSNRNAGSDHFALDLVPSIIPFTVQGVHRTSGQSITFAGTVEIAGQSTAASNRFRLNRSIGLNYRSTDGTPGAPASKSEAAPAEAQAGTGMIQVSGRVQVGKGTSLPLRALPKP